MAGIWLFLIAISSLIAILHSDFEAIAMDYFLADPAAPSWPASWRVIASALELVGHNCPRWLPHV